jgi:hypothetical protein
MLWGAHVFQAVHMRAVRCDVCGSRAMTAAAQCPTCAHHFDLRDGRGELFPLAYCSSCQSYYRESLGECRWCHTKPERPPIGPRVWRGVGAAALVALVITARLLQDDGSLDSAIEHAKTGGEKSRATASSRYSARANARGQHNARHPKRRLHARTRPPLTRLSAIATPRLQ